MENPAYWTRAEHVVQEVLDEHWRNEQKPPEERPIGWSLTRQITNALEEEGLLVRPTSN